MSYIKINGENIKYRVSIIPFTTQHGYDAIRFIGRNIPDTNKGFILYNDDDEIITDYSNYTYLYRHNEYSVEEDIKIYPQWTESSIAPNSIDILNKRVNRLNTKVNNITPYEETKIAYYGEIEKIFYNIPQGNISVFFDNYNGQYEINQVENRLIITFPNRLEKVTKITIQVSK